MEITGLYVENGSNIKVDEISLYGEFEGYRDIAIQKCIIDGLNDEYTINFFDKFQQKEIYVLTGRNTSYMFNFTHTYSDGIFILTKGLNEINGEIRYVKEENYMVGEQIYSILQQIKKMIEKEIILVNKKYELEKLVCIHKEDEKVKQELLIIESELNKISMQKENTERLIGTFVKLIFDDNSQELNQLINYVDEYIQDFFYKDFEKKYSY